MSRIVLPLALVLFALLAYGRYLHLPFFGDDYVFLDHTLHASLADVWSRRYTDFQWWRPWSREFYFWSLIHLVGVRELAFRITDLALWLAMLVLYGVFLRRLVPRPIPEIAMLGVATLALWGTPLIWISGSQDLWMLVFALTCLLLFARGHRMLAAIPLVLALLSKETAAVLPPLLVSYVLWIERESIALAMRRTAHLWAATIVWAIVHPTLAKRLFMPLERLSPLEHRSSWVSVVARTVGSTVNLHAWPKSVGLQGEIVITIAATAVLALVAFFVLARGSPDSSNELPSPSRTDVTRFAGAWWLLGWLPLLSPSIAWHAYYGCLGALGAWLILASVLVEHRGAAVAAIVVLGVLRSLLASTPSWDWGSEWYQRRAGVFVGAIRFELLRQHPTLPPHSRLFFGHIPNNIGFIAGKNPAVRVWYRDTTMRAAFYTSYRPRSIGETDGPDYFFRFDTLRALVEIHSGPEDVASSMRLNPDWESDHEKLAMLFVQSGDPVRAAVEFEKISRLPDRADAAVFAGVCWDANGEARRADSLYAAAAVRLGVSRREILDHAAELTRSIPIAR